MNINDLSRPSAGSLFMVGLPGMDLDESTRQLIADLGIHNFIIFKRNVDNKAQLAGLCRSLNRFCRENGLPTPLIAIDHEGGTVCRLPDSFTRIPAARELADSALPVERLRKYVAIMVRELKEVGVNMNLVPVLDVCPAGEGFFMESRSLSGEPERVAELGILIVRENLQQGMAVCGKHFPGLGRAVLDPHVQLPVIVRSKEEIVNEDLLPFKRSVDAGLNAIMTSHAIYTGLDPERPATLSPCILKDLLRGHMGYQGLLVSDDLEMGAIEGGRAVAEASLEAVRAGVDLLLICHEHDKVRASYEMISREAAAVLGKEAIDASLRRQQKVLSNLGKS